MGSFRDDRWECNSCGATYRSNPSKCSECGHTIFTQYRESDDQPAQAHSYHSSPETDSNKVVWYCGKCKQKHAEEPETCKVCGTAEFKQVTENPAEDDADNQYKQPEDGVETISNVREATSSPVHSETEDSNLGVYAGVAILILLGIFLISLF